MQLDVKVKVSFTDNTYVEFDSKANMNKIIGEEVFLTTPEELFKEEKCIDRIDVYHNNELFYFNTSKICVTNGDKINLMKNTWIEE